MSCAGCHRLDHNGADSKAFSLKPDGSLTETNTPTIFNAALNAHLGWDGRTADLRDEIHRSPNLDVDWALAVRRLRRDYGPAFAAEYRDGLTAVNLVDALAHFQKTLITPGARFDRYLAGEVGALSAREREGYRLFNDYGCVACHQGVNAGGNIFQRFGVVDGYFSTKTTLAPADHGLFNVTGDPRDRYVFRVPPLRNVAVTPPYFHDGSAANLERAVEVMGRTQLGRPIPGPERDAIVAFLNTLTGEYRGRALTAP